MEKKNINKMVEYEETGRKAAVEKTLSVEEDRDWPDINHISWWEYCKGRVRWKYLEDKHTHTEKETTWRSK